MLHTARPTLLLAALLLPVLVPPAAAQSRPLGAVDGDTQAQASRDAASVRETLGGCPVEALRAAWGEMGSLEAVAVEQEVLRDCTGRTREITSFITAQRELNMAFGTLLPPAERLAPPGGTGTASTPAPDDPTGGGVAPQATPGLAALRSEVEVLQARVDTLEGQPDGSPTLSAARAALAEAEERLAAAERDTENARQAASPVGTDGNSPSREEPAQTGMDRVTTADPEATSSPEYSPGDPAPGADRKPDYGGAIDPAGAELDRPEGSGTTPDLTGMLARLLPGLVTGADGKMALPEETLSWTLIYTARAGEGPWKAQVLGEGSRPIILPPLTEDGEPRIEWQSFTQGPFLLGVGDALPGDPEGRVVTEIGSAGVRVRSETAPDLKPEAAVPLTWHQGGDPTAPGRADWIVTKIEGAGIEASE